MFPYRFAVNHPIIILGFGLYNFKNKLSNLQITIDLRVKNTNTSIAYIRRTLESDGSTPVYEVRFQENIKLQKNLMYVVNFSIKKVCIIIFKHILNR